MRTFFVAMPWLRIVAAGLFAVSAFAAGPVLAVDDDDDDDEVRVRIAPIFSKPGGQSYGRWAAEWWQWALGVPAATNPLIDETGENCGQRQVDDTWFLAGSLGGAPVVRDCQIPAGKALFFPLINNFLGAFLSDPPETRTEAFLRDAARCEGLLEAFAEIDDVRLGKRRLGRLTTGDRGSQSPLFNLQLPPGNLFGVGEDVVPELVLSPSAEEGFYIYLRPLAPGEHRLRWVVSAADCAGGEQDITYNLTILEPDDDGEDD